MSVTNNKLQVATKGSGHQATTQGPTDICYDKTKSTSAPYDNYDPTENLTPGTSKTLIAGAVIWNKSHVLAAPSLPAHDGTGGGVVSGTYIDLAAPTMCSPDCKAEGDGVIRSTDTTTQNKANTIGMVTMMTDLQKMQMALDLLAGLDKLVKVEGICSHGRVLDIPRGGKRTGELLYLEILHEDSVVFQATRENAIHAGGPECRLGKHTLWRVSRSGLCDIEQTGDIFELPGYFTDIPDFVKSKEWRDEEAKEDKDADADAQSFEPTSRHDHDAEPEAEEEGDGPVEYSGPFGEPHDQDDWAFRRDANEKRDREYLKTTRPEEKQIAHDELSTLPVPKVTGITPPTPLRKNPSKEERKAYAKAKSRYDKHAAEQRRRIKESVRQQRFREAERRANERAEKMRDEYNHKIARNTALIQTGMTALKDFDLFRKLWNAYHNPPEIHLTATACSGAKMAIIKVFPAGKHKFDLFSDAISTTFEAIKRLAFGMQGPLKTLGCDFVIEFLVDPRVEIEVEYRELFEDSINGLTKGCVNLAWGLTVSFEKFVYGFLEWDWPLERVLAGIPALSLLLQVLKWAAWAFDKELEAVAYIKVEIDWKLGLVVECDEYDAMFAFPITGLKLVFEVGAKVDWDAANELGICAFAEVTADIDDARPSRDAIVELHSKGGLTVGLKGWVHVDFWMVRENCDASITLYETSLGERWFQFPPTG